VAEEVGGVHAHSFQTGGRFSRNERILEYLQTKAVWIKTG